MLERETGRSRGFGFITYADRRAMDDSIREMHGRDFGDRVISVNRAEPKMGRDDGESHGSRGGSGYSFAGKGGFGGGPGGGGGGRVAEDECFKCGRVGHWARDCPSASGGRGGPPPVGGFSSRAAFGGSDGRVDRYADRDRYVDRERYIDDRYDGARFSARDRFDSRDAYIPRDRYTSDRYGAPADRFAGGERYSRGSERYPPPAGYDKARPFERDIVANGGGDRYGGGRVGGPMRGDEGRGFRSRAGPYERPSRSGGGYPSSSSFDRY